MKLDALLVKAFDGSRRAVIGEVDMPIRIGPTTSPLLFKGWTFTLHIVTFLEGPGFMRHGK